MPKGIWRCDLERHNPRGASRATGPGPPNLFASALYTFQLVHVAFGAAWHWSSVLCARAPGCRSHWGCIGDERTMGNPAKD